VSATTGTPEGIQGRPGPTRLGAVSYLNTRPLVYGLEEHREILLRFDVPARCADLLEGGLIDLGLIPAFEYARHPDYYIVPDVAIASRGAVESVALFTRRDVRDVRSISLDTSSRTSASLVRLLCAAHFHITPTFRQALPDLEAMLAVSDAALVIGDPALFTDPIAHGVTKIDLGSVWAEMTGLPFVWAFWAGRAGGAPHDVCRLLRATRDRGVTAIDAIARREAPDDEAHARFIARYLREAIAYDLSGPFLDGLRTFYALLSEYRLADRSAGLRLF
jgi:chorismate dehydratase